MFMKKRTLAIWGGALACCLLISIPVRAQVINRQLNIKSQGVLHCTDEKGNDVVLDSSDLRYLAGEIDTLQDTYELKCKQEYTRGFNDALSGINTQYTFHVHSHSANNSTMTFNSVAEATSYFKAHPCANTASTGGGCFGSYHPAHTHNYNCYVKTVCGRWHITLYCAQGDGTSHWECAGCGSVTYQSENTMDDYNHYKQQLACSLPTASYYSTTCGHQHGELVSAKISF